MITDTTDGCTSTSLIFLPSFIFFLSSSFPHLLPFVTYLSPLTPRRLFQQLRQERRQQTPAGAYRCLHTQVCLKQPPILNIMWSWRSCSKGVEAEPPAGRINEEGSSLLNHVLVEGRRGKNLGSHFHAFLADGCSREICTVKVHRTCFISFGGSLQG